MCLTKSTRVRQLIVKQTGCLPRLLCKLRPNVCHSHKTRQNNVTCHERRQWAFSITYKKILNKSNAILAACLHLLATFGLECRAFTCQKNTICKKMGGGGKRPPAPPHPPPMINEKPGEGVVRAREGDLTNFHSP